VTEAAMKLGEAIYKAHRKTAKTKPMACRGDNDAA
jgi:hypothetical protein